MPPDEADSPELNVTSAAYDGRTLSLTWTGAPDARYNVQVAASDGTVVAETVVEGLSAMIDFVAQPGGGYTVDVSEATGAMALVGGPVWFVTDGCAVTSAATAANREVTIEWEPPQAPGKFKGFIPVVLWEGTETPLDEQQGNARSATLPLPASIPGGAAIAVRALTGASIGPIGNAAPILTLSPEDVEVSYDGANVDVSWTPLADVRVDGYDVTLAVSGQPPQTKRVSASSWPIAYTKPSPPEPTVSVTVAAATGPSTGPPSAPVDVVLDAPAISSAAFDGETATVAWSAVTQPAAVDGYRLELRSGETTVASVTTGGAGPAIGVPPGGGPFSVRMLALAPSSTGPPSAPVDLLVEAPEVLYVETPPVDNPTVTWTSVTGASGYTLVVFLDGEAQPPVSVTGTSYRLQNPLAPGQDVAVAVAAKGSSEDGAELTGPFGPRFRLPSGHPPITSVDFYGHEVVVGWERLVEGSNSYHACVLAPPNEVVSSVDADPNARSALLPFPVSNPSGYYAVSLQAQFGLSMGPSGNQEPLVQEALYLGAPSGVPVVFRADSLPFAPAATTVYLPNIGPLENLPFSGSSRPSPPFLVAANGDANSKARYPYTLTIAHGALAFTTNDSIRADVQTAYGDLLAAASTHKATPWGIWVLQQAIARAMPQTFAETLFYSYGLLPTGQSADLRPGMILRVAYSEFDLMPGIGKPPPWSTGYAGGAVVDYELGDYFDSGGRTWLVGFDAFVAWLASNAIVNVAAPETSAGGQAFSETGAADLFFPDFRQPFHRLFFPSSLQATTPPAQPVTAQQFTLAAAGTWPTISSASPSPSRGVSVAYFRGRAVVKLAIRVVVNGVEEVVPIGTTVGNVLDRLARRPPSTSVGLRGVTLERSLGPAVFNPNVPYDADGGLRVRLDWDPLLVVGAPYDATSLPLLHGDRLTIGAS